MKGKSKVLIESLKKILVKMVNLVKLHKKEVLAGLCLFLIVFIPTFLYVNLTNPTMVNKLIASVVNKGTPANNAFEDETFYNAIIDSYNKENSTNLPYTTSLSDEQLGTIRTIDYDGEGKTKITNINGIEKLTGITVLKLDNNNLNNIDVSNNKIIDTLWLSDNNLTNIDLSNNKIIKSIELNGNNLTDIDLSNNVEVERVRLENNNISELNLLNNSKIKALYLSGNENLQNIENSYIYNLSDILTVLSVEDVTLNNFDFSKFPRLRVLNMGNNKITSLDLSLNGNINYMEGSGGFLKNQTNLILGENAYVRKGKKYYQFPNFKMPYSFEYSNNVSDESIAKAKNSKTNILNGGNELIGLEVGSTEITTRMHGGSFVYAEALNWTLNVYNIKSDYYDISDVENIIYGVTDTNIDEILSKITVENANVKIENNKCLILSKDDEIVVDEFLLKKESKPIEPINLSIDQEKIQMDIASNKEIKLNAIINPNDAENKNILWSSANSAVAKVDSDGNVTAVGEGSTYIIAHSEYGNISAKCLVTVIDSEIRFNNNDGEFIDAGEKKEIEVDKSTWLNNYKVLYESLDENIATVNENGRITGVHTGITKIKVITEDGKKVGYFDVEVRANVKSITFDETDGKVYKSDDNQYYLELEHGQSYKLKPKILPSDAYNKNINWSSSNSAVAEVDSDGNITAVAEGTTDIIARSEYGNVSTPCLVTVIDPEIHFNNNDGKFIVAGEHKEIEVDKSTWPNNYKVLYESLDENVAIVDERGRITGIHTGITKIKVITENGKKVGYYDVEVRADIESITFDETDEKIKKSDDNRYYIELEHGQSYKLKPKILPSDAYNKNIEWSSSNEKIVTVDQEGVITAVGDVFGVHTAGITGVVNKIASDKQEIITLNVEVIYGEVKLDTENLELGLGDKYKVTATVEPKNLINKDIIWRSSDENYVTVDQNGNIEVVKGVVRRDDTSGTCSASYNRIISIYAKVNGGQESRINVKIKPSIKFDTGDFSLEIGNSKKINIFNDSAGACTNDLLWASSDESIAMVDQNGVVTPIKTGKAIISATSTNTTDNGLKREITVTVKDSSKDDQMLGDVNNDGTVDLFDVLIIVKSIQDTATLTDEQKVVANVYEKEQDTIDLFDVLKVISYIQGKVDKL